VQVRAHAADNRTGSRATGYYDDELLETDDGWKIARRRFTMVLLQLVPDGTVIDVDATTGSTTLTRRDLRGPARPPPERRPHDRPRRGA